MNEKGWGLKDAVIFIVIICLALFISMITYHRTFKGLFDSSDSIEETYADIEKELENTAHTYTDNYYYKVLENGDSGVVTIRDMQEEKLIRVVRDIKNNNVICSGYVKFKKSNGKTIYTAYLNCKNNYQTKGYQSKYDEPVKN